MRLMRYDFTISHIPGKDLTIADTLSRAPVGGPQPEDLELEQETDAYVHYIMQSLPASDRRLQEIKDHLRDDETSRLVMSYCQDGWPPRKQLKGPVRQFWKVASQLSVEDGLLMRGSRLVIPLPLQSDILGRLHEGHQGIVKCRERARESVWWPGLNAQLENLVFNCPVCQKQQVQRPEPLHPTPFPQRPWERLGADLFDWKGSKYLLLVDYFSRFIEIAKLSGESCAEVVKHMKSIMARHGVPAVVVSDNGPQFSAAEFKKFSAKYGFVHKTRKAHPEIRPI